MDTSSPESQELQRDIAPSLDFMETYTEEESSDSEEEEMVMQSKFTCSMSVELTRSSNVNEKPHRLKP